MHIPNKLKSRAKVLVVDDESSITDVLEMALSQRFELFVAKNGDEAIRICETHPIDLLLTDFDMPETTGSELIRELRERKLVKRCVLFSGRMNPDLWEQAVNAGSRYILKKPFSLRQLGSLMDYLLEPKTTLTTKHLTPLATLPWRSELGQGIAALSMAVPQSKQILFLQTPGGRLPEAMLRELSNASAGGYSESQKKNYLLYEAIDQSTLDEQEQIARKLKFSKKSFRVIVGSDDPDRLMEKGHLHDQIYMQLSPESITIPEPSQSVEDASLYLEWYLAQRKITFSDAGRTWFQSKLEALSWEHVFAWIEAVLSEFEPNSMVSKEALQRAYAGVIPPGAFPVTFEDFLPDFSAQFEDALRHLESALE